MTAAMGSGGDGGAAADLGGDGERWRRGAVATGSGGDGGGAADLGGDGERWRRGAGGGGGP